MSAQDDVENKNCVPNISQNHIDSLTNLLLANRPIQVLQISDSLLLINDQIDCSGVIKVRSAKANAYELLYNFEAAIETYLDVLDSAKKIQSIDDQIWISLSLARAYEFIGRGELCLFYLNYSKQLIDSHKLDVYLSRYYVRLASYHRIYNNRDSSQVYAQLAVELGEQYNVNRSIGDGSLILGVLSKDFERSISHLQRAADTFLSMGDYSGSMSQELNIAFRLYEMKKYDRTHQKLRYVERNLPHIIDNKKWTLQLKLRLTSLKAALHEVVGNKDSVIIELKNKINYTNEFGALVNQEQINQLLIDNSVKLEQEKVEDANRRALFLIISSILLGIISILALWAYMSNRASKRHIEQQNELISSQYEDLENLYNYKSTLLNEVHHRIKNNLQLIISILALQKSKLNPDQDAEILSVLTNRLSSIALIHEQLYSFKTFESIAVLTYLENLMRKFRSITSHTNITFNSDINDELHINLETITPLGLIWSELISNSLKYNPNLVDIVLSISLEKKGAEFYMHYKDNGVGYPNGEFTPVSNGMGYTIINSLSTQLFSKTRVFNDHGANFIMIFGEKHVSTI